ncbi:MAG: hypothetical protein WCG36_07510, partial [bacterium]
MARQPNSTARTDIEKRLSCLVKGALAFSRITDRLKQKAVIQQLFAEIHIGGDGITGFKLRPQFDADVCKDGSHTDGASHIADILFLLPEPYTTSSNPIVCDGKKYCPKCQLVLSLAQFSPVVKGRPTLRYACTECLRRMCQEHYKRKRTLPIVATPSHLSPAEPGHGKLGSQTG